MEEEKGRAKRPVSGISVEELDAIQKEMVGLNYLIRPAYNPKISIEGIDGKHILVIWVPGGNDRPYEGRKILRQKKNAIAITSEDTPVPFRQVVKSVMN